MDPATPFIFFLAMAWYWLLWVPLLPLTVISALYFHSWRGLWIGLALTATWMIMIFQCVKWY
jgi:hypothetical protein